MAVALINLGLIFQHDKLITVNPTITRAWPHLECGVLYGKGLRALGEHRSASVHPDDVDSEIGGLDGVVRRGVEFHPHFGVGHPQTLVAGLETHTDA